MIRRPPRSPLFPYTPLFRSEQLRIGSTARLLHHESDQHALKFSLPADKALRLRRMLRSEEHTSELQSQSNLVCRLLLEKKKKINISAAHAVNYAANIAITGA